MTLLVPRRVGVGVAALLSLGFPGFLPNSVSAQQEGHGIQEFTDSTTWRVPAGVTHIIVELWGAGGGGGAGTFVVVGGAQSAGGGGGGGPRAETRRGRSRGGRWIPSTS